MTEGLFIGADIGSGKRKGLGRVVLSKPSLKDQVREHMLSVKITLKERRSMAPGEYDTLIRTRRQHNAAEVQKAKFESLLNSALKEYAWLTTSKKHIPNRDYRIAQKTEAISQYRSDIALLHQGVTDTNGLLRPIDQAHHED